MYALHLISSFLIYNLCKIEKSRKEIKGCLLHKEASFYFCLS
jgi:hypothetical protein